ncbi:MAG: ribonuclease HI family protein [Actinomycetota bacterium]|nr:ribonuclease HI family protein [Actinomycetota bacterium]
MSDTHLLYADGASRGNPGPAAIGFVLIDPEGTTVVERGAVIGTATNNVAEYQALIAGLEAALSRGVRDLEVRLDSLLLVRQVSGEFRVKAEHLKPLHRRVSRLLRDFDRVRVGHVRRESNTRADALANVALDEDR